MNAPADDLGAKIARLVEEKGWNQEEFARLAQLHRLTVRNIFAGASRKLHNATVGACCRALGLSVHELRTLPLEALLFRLGRQQTDRLQRDRPAALADEERRRLYERATQPEVVDWLERHPDKAAQLKPDEIDELLSLQGTGGPLTNFGVDKSVDQILRRRKLLEKVLDIAGTELIDLLEPLVDMMHEKIQPYGDRLEQYPEAGS
jgi:transcriptional regulator with XRE-family HTH domain